MLKKAWIDPEAYDALAKDLSKDALIKKELENISKCTDIQRHVITAILAGNAGKEIKPEKKDRNPFHVGSLAEVDKQLP